MILILLGGLLSLPQEQFEAAEIDGASGWNKFRYITLPMLKPIISIAILFRLIDSLKVVNKIYILTQGGPGLSTYTMSYFTFYYGLGYLQDVGLAAAASLIFLFIVLTISTLFIIFVARGALLNRG
jgi:multiple sugar transport system permease protein